MTDKPMTPLERAARALYAENDVWSNAIEWDKLDSAERHQYMIFVRAVLLAIRDPSEAMVEEGRWPAEDDGPVACWQAMIDAALEERHE